MLNVSIQSPDLRTVERALLDLGFLPDSAWGNGEYWYEPATAQQCHIVPDMAIRYPDLVYRVEWL